MKTTVNRTVAALTAAVIVATHLSAAETIIDDVRGFTLTLPEGFVANPGLVGATPDIVHAFVLGGPTDEDPGIFLFIEKMRGIIGRELLNPDDVPPGYQARMFTTRWQDFEVDAFAVPEQLGEIRTITSCSPAP